MKGKLNLKDVLVVPNLKKKLLSIRNFFINILFTFEFTLFGFIVKD